MNFPGVFLQFQGVPKLGEAPRSGDEVVVRFLKQESQTGETASILKMQFSFLFFKRQAQPHPPRCAHRGTFPKLGEGFEIP